MWTDAQVESMLHAHAAELRAKDALIAEYAHKQQQLQLAVAKLTADNAALTDTINELRQREVYRL